MESSIGSIVNKIDAVLTRLETMEGGKARRRAAMNKMLTSITENDDGNNKDYFNYSVNMIFLAN